MSFGNCESVAINQLIKDKEIARIPFIDSDSKNYWPQVFTLDNSSSDPIERAKRIPNKAWELVKEGLKSGNVLIQVPRLGYSNKEIVESNSFHPRHPKLRLIRDFEVVQILHFLFLSLHQHYFQGFLEMSYI